MVPKEKSNQRTVVFSESEEKKLLKHVKNGHGIIINSGKVLSKQTGKSFSSHYLLSAGSLDNGGSRDSCGKCDIMAFIIAHHHLHHHQFCYFDALCTHRDIGACCA